MKPAPGQEFVKCPICGRRMIHHHTTRKHSNIKRPRGATAVTSAYWECESPQCRHIEED